MEFTSAYRAFVADIKEQIRQARYTALREVNKELVRLYFYIGQQIALKQEAHGWGKSVVETLANDLREEFPETKGFSNRNLWYMKKMYENYKGNSKLQTVSAEITWSHNVAILDKCKDHLEQEYYLQMTRKFGWSRNVLIHQIEAKSYQRFLTEQTNFDKTLEGTYKDQASLAVKDEYVFDFLDLSEAHKERDLESALLLNMRRFLVEMGGDFAFIGNQHRLQVGEQEFFIDLLLYHRRLRSLVAIELKVTEFKPEHAGKMQFYLTALDAQNTIAGESLPIGIIICKSKDRTVVEYAIKNSSNPIGVATYAIRQDLPEEIKKYLPSAEEITKRLEILYE